MSILNSVPFLDGDKHVRGARPYTCLPEEKARQPCLRHTFGSYLRGSPRDRLGIRGSGGPLFAESSGTAFLPCPFLTLSLVCWEDLGHPVLSLTDYFQTPWGRRCDLGVVWERETGCWLVGSISWFIHVIRIVQLFCQFCTGCFL